MLAQRAVEIGQRVRMHEGMETIFTDVFETQPKHQRLYAWYEKIFSTRFGDNIEIVGVDFVLKNATLRTNNFFKPVGIEVHDPRDRDKMDRLATVSRTRHMHITVMSGESNEKGSRLLSEYRSSDISMEYYGIHGNASRVEGRKEVESEFRNFLEKRLKPRLVIRQLKRRDMEQGYAYEKTSDFPLRESIRV